MTTLAGRALTLFEQALERPEAERGAFLDAACASPALRAEIDALLAADARAGAFLEQPLVLEADAAPGGRVLGAYRLLRHLGDGGMGSVWLAERADGAYSKPVALKLLRFDAPDLRRRFALEQRVLGSLAHPNIAQLIDVGLDERGAPFLVMEYVDGTPLTGHAEAAGLDLRQRVTLMLKVLDAVQAAHARLVVHRDLKPGNVLVDARGEPKLLDFGIAKLLDATEPGLTRTAHGPLTPEYASPEQVRGEPLGPASDIYSLGVLLYELVAGTRPYRFDSSAPSAIERTICDSQPPPPSRLAGATARPRRAAIGDLDHVVLKALAKTPTERYASCSELADELRAWLDDRPVRAREPGAFERLRRYARRHRAAAAALLLALAGLLAGSAIALWQAARAREEAAQADLSRARAERLNRFLVTMLSAADPAVHGAAVPVSAVLEEAGRALEAELGNDPEVALEAMATLAQTYQALGDAATARRWAERARALAATRNNAGALAAADLALGAVLSAGGDYAAAQAPLERARAHYATDPQAREQLARAENELGSLASHAGDAQAAERRFAAALALSHEPVLRAQIQNNRAIATNARGASAEALAAHRAVVDELRRAYARPHPHTAKALVNLADALEIDGQLDAARPVLAEGLAMQRTLLGEHHPDVVQSLASLTWLELRRNDPAAALAAGHAAAAAAQALPEQHPMRAYALAMAGEALLASGDAAAAVTRFRDALAIRAAILPPGHPLVANTESALGLALVRSGSLDEGRAFLEGALAALESTLGPQHELTARARERLRASTSAP